VHKDCFQIFFQSARVEINISELIEILCGINEQDDIIFDLGFLHSLRQLHEPVLRTNPEYKLFFGRIYFFLNQVEITEFISQLWTNHPMMMQWVCTKKDAKQNLPSLPFVEQNTENISKIG